MYLFNRGLMLDHQSNQTHLTEASICFSLFFVHMDLESTKNNLRVNYLQVTK